MQLSCLPVSLFPNFFNGSLSIPAWAEAAKKIGFDGFDISAMFFQNHVPTYLTKLAEDVEKIGIPMVMVSSYPDFTNRNPAQAAREEAYLACDMAVSAQMGAKYLRVLAGQAHPGMDRAAGVAAAVAGLKRAAATARAHGITLVYENHAKPAAWHYIDFSFPPDIFLKVFDGIADTDVMLNFDVGNATAETTGEGDELKLLERVFDKVATFHVCDMKQKGVFSPTLVGTGKTPLPELFRFIKSKGFDGWFCIEEASGMGMDGVQKAHDYVRNLWDKTPS